MKRYLIPLLALFLFVLASCEEELETFQISYELNDGLFIEETEVINEVKYGRSIQEPSVEKEGFTFIGWYSDSTLNVAYDFSNPVFGDLTLYAGWEYNNLDVVKYEFIAEILKILEDANIREGYTLEGWYLDEALTEEIDVSEILGDEDISIYAEWSLNQYNVSYVFEGNVLLEEQYYYGEEIVLSTDFEMDGYEFEGNYLTEDHFFPVVSGFDMPAQDLLIYVNMEEIKSEYSIVFVPSRDAATILEITAPLPDLLSEELENLGFPNVTFDIYVSSSYESAGEGLLAGIYDVGFLPGSTYVQYADALGSSIDVLLAATRNGLTVDSPNPIDWNTGTPTQSDTENQAAYYRGLIIAGTSPAAQTVAGIVNSGNTLIWDDIKDLNWCVRSAYSSSGYLYPNLWLYDNFDGKTIADLTNVVQTDGYGSSMAAIANGTCDVATFYGDARMTYAAYWQDSDMGYGRTLSIWEETNVIGVTSNIMNDTISVSTTNLTPELIEAIAQAFINIAQTSEGEQIISIYSHDGYIQVDDEDYDAYRRILTISD